MFSIGHNPFPTMGAKFLEPFLSSLVKVHHGIPNGRHFFLMRRMVDGSLGSECDTTMCQRIIERMATVWHESGRDGKSQEETLSSI
jgi:hypothetical protein